MQLALDDSLTLVEVELLECERRPVDRPDVESGARHPGSLVRGYGRSKIGTRSTKHQSQSSYGSAERISG